MRRAVFCLLLALSACETAPAASAAAKSGCDASMPANASTLEMHLCRVGEKGSGAALYDLGADYLYAREGTRRDCGKARFFMATAAARGDLFARMKMAELLGGGVFTSADSVKSCTTADFVQAHAYLRAANNQIKEAAKEKQAGAPSVGILPDLEPGIAALAGKLDIKGKNESDAFYRELTKKPE